MSTKNIFILDELGMGGISTNILVFSKYLNNSLICVLRKLNKSKFRSDTTSLFSPFQTVRLLINQNQNLTNDFMNASIDVNAARESVVSVNVFYDSLSYRIATESPKLDVITTLANVGGSLSLFMGVSVLSVVEVLILLLDVFIFKFRCIYVKKNIYAI